MCCTYCHITVSVGSAPESRGWRRVLLCALSAAECCEVCRQCTRTLIEPKYISCEIGKHPHMHNDPKRLHLSGRKFSREMYLVLDPSKIYLKRKSNGSIESWRTIISWCFIFGFLHQRRWYSFILFPNLQCSVFVNTEEANFEILLLENKQTPANTTHIMGTGQRGDGEQYRNYRHQCENGNLSYCLFISTW